MYEDGDLRPLPLVSLLRDPCRKVSLSVTKVSTVSLFSGRETDLPERRLFRQDLCLFVF